MGLNGQASTRYMHYHFDFGQTKHYHPPHSISKQASNAIIMKEGLRIMPETDSFEMVHFLWGRDFRRRRTKGCVSAIFCRVELGLAALYYHSTTTRQQQLEKAADGPTFYFSFFWPKKTSKK